ncbi:MAG: NAD-binding protein [Gammaproteobacteria bacterium]|nr:NAD-binding protein [Gammaproteobacteria bacterium]
MSDRDGSSLRPSWRSTGALLFFFSALIGFQLGVSVSERPEIVSAGILVHAYYSLSLFVVGGVDLGTPQGGPLIGRILVWMAYFGAPILAASTLIDAFIRGLAPQRWQLRRVKDHIVVVGANELALSYLRVLRKQQPNVTVILVCKQVERSMESELKQAYGAIVVVGDVTHEYFLEQLRLERAQKVLLLGGDSLRNYEAASIITKLHPDIGSRVIIHCGSLRFMRAMANTRVAQQCQTFNTYHLAASGLVRNHLVGHFHETAPKDLVVLAGFGRFGQTILEELQLRAANEMDTVAIIDIDAHRRLLVADEQMEFSGNYHRELVEGDISHPDVWEQLRSRVTLNSDDTVVILGTGREEENLRTALWIREQFPKAKVIVRSSKESRFATEVGEEHNIISISITQLVEENIPRDWLEPESTP